MREKERLLKNDPKSLPPAACDVLIVGSGHGGAQAAIALRQRKFAGSIALLGDEPDLPYERPPLSKDYLSGTKPFNRILIRPQTFWTDRDIALLRGRRVVAVDPASRRATLQDGTIIGYGTLIWAAGGVPRRLTCSGHDLHGVHGVRTRADVDRMIAELPAVERIVVVGGGYIGLEAAAVLTKLGKMVTVLEAQDRVLARVAGEPLSRFFEAEHRAHGVDLRTSALVDCIEERGGTATGVRLSQSEFLPCEMVIVGIGIIPSCAPLLAAGAIGENGVLVDELCRTNLPDIFAIGDCAAHANPFAGGAVIRIESVQNAVDQANTVAKLLCGVSEPYHAVPWFWSDQYDLKLQTVGLSAAHDRMIVRGDPASRSFSLVYLRKDRVIALDCVNATRDYAQGRGLVARQTRVEAMAVSDPAIALKDIAIAGSGFSPLPADPATF